MNPKCPYGVCYKAVAKNHNAVCCDSCNLWVHIKCNNLTKFCYRKLQTCHEPWYCKNCIKQILPFSELSESQLSRVTTESFSDFFTLNTQLHHHNTRGNKLIVPNINTTRYGSNSITLKAIKQWNEMQNFVKTDILSQEMTYFKLLKIYKNLQ